MLFKLYFEDFEFRNKIDFDSKHYKMDFIDILSKIAGTVKNKIFVIKVKKK